MIDPMLWVGPDQMAFFLLGILDVPRHFLFALFPKNRGWQKWGAEAEESGASVMEEALVCTILTPHQVAFTANLNARHGGRAQGGTLAQFSGIFHRGGLP